MTNSNSGARTFFDAALIVVFTGLLFGTAPASADPTETTLIPTPDPSEGGGVHRSPTNGGAGSPVQPVLAPPPKGRCLSCPPEPIPNGAAAPGPGPAPTITPPELTGSNSGVPATATNLVIWGDHFHPGDAVYLEVRGNDGTLYWQHDGLKADGAGHLNVTTSRGTDRATPINGYALANDRTSGLDTARLPVAIKGGPPPNPSVVDH